MCMKMDLRYMPLPNHLDLLLKHNQARFLCRWRVVIPKRCWGGGIWCAVDGSFRDGDNGFFGGIISPSIHVWWYINLH